MENSNKNLIPTNKDLNEIKYDSTNIKNLIYTIRGKQVMLDSDVAMLYGYETKNLNKAMKRNFERFPQDFCFQLTEKEFEILRFQFGTLNRKVNNGSVTRKYLPYVYTEQGISMLSGILKNELAIKVSINIMRAFVKMRNFLNNNANLFNRLTCVEYKLLEHNKKFDIVFNELQKDKSKEFKHQIFFDGQIYDAYSLIIDIIKSANKKILIIDNYIDDSIFKMLSKKNENVKAVLLTSQKCNLTALDIKNFNKQYPIIKICRTNKFHDRFILIDNNTLYHCGASLKDAGKKCFAINKIEDIDVINKIDDYCN